MGLRPHLGGMATGAPERPTSRVRRPRARSISTAAGGCYVGGEDQNERIVRKGWALAFRRYSTSYLQAEAAAKRAGAGIWRGEFTPPWEWRAERR